MLTQMLEKQNCPDLKRTSGHQGCHSNVNIFDIQSVITCPSSKILMHQIFSSAVIKYIITFYIVVYH